MKKREALSGAQTETSAVDIPLGERLHRLVQRQPLLFVAATAVAGVTLGSVLSDRFPGVSHPTWRYTWSAFVVAGLVAIIAARPSLRRWATVLVVMPFAALLHCQRDAAYDQVHVLAVTSSHGQPTVLRALVDRPAVLRRHPLAQHPGRRRQSPWQTQIEVTLQQLRIGQRFEPSSGRLLVVIDGRLDEIRPGDVVEIYGTIRQFAPPTNPGERDRRPVYHRRHLHARVDVNSTDQIITLSTRATGLIYIDRLIAGIATKGRDQLLKQTSVERGPLAVALVLGQRDFVDANTRDQLLVTGTAHLLSVSGLHLAIVVVLASSVATLLRLPMMGKIVWIVSICLFYTALTGGRPPVMRASILVGTFMLSLWMRRVSQPINTLSFAALILILINPEYVFSVGVQLSFLAVATLVLCGQRPLSHSPAVDQSLQQEQRLKILVDHHQRRTMAYLRYSGRAVWRLTWFSSCVTAISLPLVWQQFHIVSPVSVLTNVAMGPFLFLSLASGIVTVIGGFLFEPLAIIPGKVCDLTLQTMWWIIESASAMPYGHFWLPSPPAWWVAMFYIGITASLFLPTGRRSSSIRYGWIGGWIVIAWFLATAKPALPEGTCEATFLDVGHGTCVVLRFAGDDVWLYDCGRLGNDSNSSRTIDEALWSLGVTRLNGIFLSHADADHFNALPGVLRRFHVKEIITPPGMLLEREPALDPIRAAIDRSGTPTSEIARGAVLVSSDHPIHVLHPPATRLEGSDNANSLVLRFDRGGKSLILPGDLEPPGTQELIDSARPPPGGAMMAPHHGSLRMDARSILQWARPRETIVSGGQRARKPEVREMLAGFGSAVHITSVVGAIRVQIDSDGETEVRDWVLAPW